MARDRFLPSLFTFRGDRLAFTTGIAVLALLASGLVVLFGGSEQALIPLFALGVFLSFTLSQAGMVVHHWRLREPRWRRSLVLNAAGALSTLVVLAVIVGSKFTHEAWMVVVLIPVLVLAFRGMARHYRDVADDLLVTAEERATKPTLDPARIEHTVLIPVADANGPALAAANAGPDGTPCNQAVVRWALQHHLGVTDRGPQPLPYDAARAREVVGRYANDAMTLTIGTEGAGLRLESRLKPEVRAALATDPGPDYAPAAIGLLPGAEDEYVVTDGGQRGLRGFFTRDDCGVVVGVDLAGRLFTREPADSP
jgi:hypothetical protein